MSAAYDSMGTVHIMSGQFRTNFDLGAERLALLSRLSTHQPRAGTERQDLLHMGVENAVTAGELLVAMDVCALFADDGSATPHMLSSKPIVPLMLLGRFEEAIDLGLESRALWEQAGSPAARWMAPAMYAVVMCFGVRGETELLAEWRDFAGIRIAGEQTRNVHFQVGGMTTFVDARLALHDGDLDEALRAVEYLPTEPDAWWNVRHYYLDAYPWALAADVAAAAAHPDAAARVAAAEPIASQHPWAAACVARARYRLHGDPADIAESLAGWERVGARYERASTLVLLPERADEGRRELAALGVVTEPA